ncbi:hypothetical protein ACXYTJ_10785 [Gilvimarinus sp. F26214L]|uniref:hypothetical protein n=1 Tax=Gilvimarinus sp. DZF01 TaxID=3461371 RepID=UPI004045221F
MNRTAFYPSLISAFFIALVHSPAQALDGAEPAPTLPAEAYLSHGEVHNAEAPIPPQCYTRTEGKYNPCYVCHQSYAGDKRRTNGMRDGFQQGSYAFSDLGVKNHWSNLFRDRRKEIAGISDEFIVDYVHQDNFSHFIDSLRSSEWSGVIPALEGLHRGAAAFDQYGLARDGSHWVAFNYKPLPSTFWPTNGSTDDVMIRLEEPFRQLGGEFSRDVYYANLALLELAISGELKTSSIALNERHLQTDLNGDGKLTAGVTQVQRRSHYVGDASDTKLSHMLYPEGTEFLHTVRYVGVDDGGRIYNAPRMKEVRYMRKDTFMPRERLMGSYYREAKEKHFGNLPFSVHRGEQGTSNGFGWLLVGFIEDEQGELRPQHEQEQQFCMGCHKTVGATIDQTFAFPRKMAGADGWGYIDLKKLTDAPNVDGKTGAPEPAGEYLTYLQRVGGGDEFRQNREMLERWFNEDGTVKVNEVRALPSIYELITPSRERALALNKAYYLIVREQSFLFGRDAVLAPASNVYGEVDTEVAPLPPTHHYPWDIRLHWPGHASGRPGDISSKAE